ncbi:hypothetical protein [Crassaminicella indica]|uniref:Uncharacterized protein n=1 Tax=Crassaminicella indica TaxID=2855394 RepID=A0ABX8RCH6_9CLOT|nr:hypothetical protein [Crassaminicella indica]QXM06167.1 hypothetical protein KVH43_12585 [Crassaminicella indica]
MNIVEHRYIKENAREAIQKAEEYNNPKCPFVRSEDINTVSSNLENKKKEVQRGSRHVKGKESLAEYIELEKKIDKELELSKEQDNKMTNKKL